MMVDRAQMLRDMMAWATLRGKSLPKTEAGMDLFVQEYLEAQQQEQEVSVVGEDEVIGDDRPLLAHDGVNVDIVDRVKNKGPFEDDWTQLLRQRQEARLGPNGEHLDDFDTEFQFIGKQHAELAAVAPFTRTTPPTVLQGSLGGQVVIKNGDLPKMVARWDGNDAEATIVTCMFAPITIPPGNSGGPAPIVPGNRLYGIVQFGTRGFLTTAQVDIGQGCQFSVPASQVNLQVAQENGANGMVSTVTGMISFGHGSRSKPSTRTVYVDNVAIGNPFVAGPFLIPPFAKRFYVIRDKTFAYAYYMDFNDTFGNVVQRFFVDTQQPYMTEPLLVAPNANSFYLVNAGNGSTQTANSGAQATSSYAVVFELDI